MSIFFPFLFFFAGEAAERHGRADHAARGAGDEPAVHVPEQQHHGVLPAGVEAEGRRRAVRVPVDGGPGGDAARGIVVGSLRRAVPRLAGHPQLLQEPADRARRGLLRGVGGQSLRRSQGAQDGRCPRGATGRAAAGSSGLQIHLAALPWRDKPNTNCVLASR
jgi:hypothetical protein